MPWDVFQGAHISITVAIIEDDPATAERLHEIISETEDMVVVATAGNLANATAMISAGGFDVLLCDLGLPDADGVKLIKLAVLSNPDVDVLVVTIFAHRSRVLASLKAGARGYLLKDDGLEQCVPYIRDMRRSGSPISPVIARELLREFAPPLSKPRAVVAKAGHLSERETDVLHMLARGFSYHEIAGLLGLSVQTVGTYVKRLYRKLEVSSRAEAVFEARSRGVLDEAE